MEKDYLKRLTNSLEHNLISSQVAENINESLRSVDLPFEQRWKNQQDMDKYLKE